MALVSYQVFNHQGLKIGLVKAQSSEDALIVAKRQYLYCVAPMVELLASVEHREKNSKERYWGGLKRYEYAQ